MYPRGLGVGFFPLTTFFFEGFPRLLFFGISTPRSMLTSIRHQGQGKGEHGYADLTRRPWCRRSETYPSM